MAIGIPNINLDLSALAELNQKEPIKRGGFGKFLTADLPQRQLGPDDFGSYTIPFSDPTYRSGFDYARSIAGGIPMSQVIAPGVSYSPEQPGGYTQEQLNIPKDVVTPPPEPPKPDDPSFLGTGIGGVNIPVDRKQIPPRNIFGGLTDTRGQRKRGEPLQGYVPGGGGINYGGAGFFDNLLSLTKNLPIDQIEELPPTDVAGVGRVPGGTAGFFETPSLEPIQPLDREQLIKDIRESIDIPSYEVPDLSGFARIEDIPTVPTFNEEALRKELMEDIRGSINIPQMPDLSGLARLEDIPQIPAFDPKDYREDFLSIAREGIDIPQYQAPDLSGFARLEDIPTFDPDILKQDILMSIPQQQVPDVSKFVTQDDITKAIAGIDIPTFQQPDLSAYDTRIAELEQQLAGLKQPTGGSFSISQPRPMGLF